MANLQGGGQVALKRLRGLTVDQLAEQIVAVPGQLAIILLHGINAQGKRIIQIVLDVALGHLGARFTCIGQIAPESEGLQFIRDGKPVALDLKGYDHFA